MNKMTMKEAVRSAWNSYKSVIIATPTIRDALIEDIVDSLKAEAYVVFHGWAVMDENDVYFIYTEEDKAKRVAEAVGMNVRKVYLDLNTTENDDVR